MRLIDMHCDTIWKLMEDNTGATLQNNCFCVDLEGLKKAGTTAQFFACFVHMDDFHGKERYTKGYLHALEMIERMETEVRRVEGEIAFAGSYEQILKNEKEKKISAVLTVEEGGILDSQMERLEELYQRGIRLMTLLWNEENCIGFPNSREKSVMQKGLKSFGFEVVEQMNALGMIVDVSHLSDGGFWDVLRTARNPVIASHSNARALCSHSRNLSDEMIRALAEKGGVAGVNFYPYFLNPSGKAGVCDLAAHVEYMVNVGGIEFVAIGTDFDGFDEGEQELTHVGEMGRLYEALRKRGFTERALDKIWSENALRVIREVL